MSTVTLGYGKVTFANASATLAAFVIEEHFQRNFPSAVFGRKAAKNYKQHFPGSEYPEVNGGMFMETLVIPDGTILCFQYSRRFRGMSMEDAAVFIRIRDTGPMYAFNAKMPTAHDSLLGDSFTVFQGRGDLLSLEDLEAANCKPGRAWIEGFMNPEEISNCYDIRLLDEETAPPPVQQEITSLSGRKVRVEVGRTSRRIRLRKDASSSD